MAFENIAKSLLTQAAPISNRNTTTKSGKEGVSEDLEAVGFSRREVLQEMRNLYDTTEEDSTKRQILDTVAKIHGLTQLDESQREIPQIIINIAGNNARVMAMLCPLKPLEGTS